MQKQGEDEDRMPMLTPELEAIGYSQWTIDYCQLVESLGELDKLFPHCEFLCRPDGALSNWVVTLSHGSTVICHVCRRGKYCVAPTGAPHALSREHPRCAYEF
jgi:hypothetical protein